MNFRRKIILFSFLMALIISIFPHATKANLNSVYVVPIEKTVESGMYQFLKKAVMEAEANHAKAIIFEMHTPGGELQAAMDIGKLISNTDIPTYVFVNNMAISAGSYIALNTDGIYMTPGATMGASTAIDMEGNAADAKTQSVWIEAMGEAASKNGRDPIYAKAMVDITIAIDEIGLASGQLLTLGSITAEQVGYSEGTVDSLNDLLVTLGFENANIVYKEETIAVKIGRFISNPYVVPILLSIGSIGLVLELYSPGFGLPGIAGISSLLLFFYGHMVVGLAGYESIILFVIGLVLIVLELYTPGGILGLLGLGSVIASIMLAGGNLLQMGYSIIIAFVLTVLVMIIMAKVFDKNMKFFRKIILTDATTTEQGYVSNENRNDLVGKKGIALTAMRPAGTALIDGERLDVVSVGEFIEKGQFVQVVQVEGSRIVITAISE